MTRPRVAVDDELSNLREELERRGFQVLSVNDAANADLIVLSGLHEDALGMEHIEVDRPILSAEGRQVEELIYDIEKHLSVIE